MGQLCFRETQENKIIQKKKSNSLRKPTLQTSGTPAIPCERFENLTNEQRYFFSMTVLKKIEKKVKRILKLQSLGEKLPSSIYQMDTALTVYIQQLLNIQEKFQLFEHVYEESEKGYIESEGYSLGFDNSLFYHSSDFKGISFDKKRFNSATKPILDKEQQGLIPSMDNLNNSRKESLKGNNSPTRERKQQRRNTEQTDSKDQIVQQLFQVHLNFEGTQELKKKSNDFQTEQGTEVFGRIAERLEQPVLVVELHKLTMESSSSMKINPQYYQFELEVQFKEGEKIQKQIFQTRKITPSYVNQSQMSISEVFEFSSETEITDSLQSSAKFKVKMITCLPIEKNNAVDKHNESDKSVKTTLCSSIHTSDNENPSKEFKLSSPYVDLKSYLDQSIEYISLNFDSQDERELRGSVQVRFQFVHDQTALVTHILSRLNTCKNAIQQVLASIDTQQS